jgi:hypothetical protein
MSADHDRKLPENEPNINNEQEAAIRRLTDCEHERVAELATRALERVQEIREARE